MSGEITQLTLSIGDITQVTVANNATSTVVIQSSDTSVLTAAPATINTATLNFSDATPQNIARVASAGTAVTASRSDHVHSAAALLLDGGNY